MEQGHSPCSPISLASCISAVREQEPGDEGCGPPASSPRPCALCARTPLIRPIRLVMKQGKPVCQSLSFSSWYLSVFPPLSLNRGQQTPWVC